MKALSIRQPWANLIEQKLKPLEIRSCKTNYRGELLICAGEKVSTIFKIDKSKCEGDKIFTYDPADPEFSGYLHYGKALFTCSLEEITPFYIEQEEDAWLKWQPSLFSWHLTNIKPIMPFSFKGKLSFFNVPDELIHYI